MYLFIAILTVGFIYELGLGAIDLKLYIISSLDRKLLYLFTFIYRVLRTYIYGFILKESSLILYTNNQKLLYLVTIMKKSEILP
jgi:hypothetical protein